MQEAKTANNEGIPFYKQLQTLQYLEMCVKEVMRLYPIAPIIARDIKKPVKLPGNLIPTKLNKLINKFKVENQYHREWQPLSICRSSTATQSISQTPKNSNQSASHQQLTVTHSRTSHSAQDPETASVRLKINLKNLLN